MKHYLKTLISGLLMLFVCVLVTISWAGTTGKISGRVVDMATGEPLPGVNVIIDGTTLGAATDLNGDFIILMIPPGSYSVTASMMGYDPFRYQQVRVSIDKTRKLDFSLSETILEAGGEVVVVAEKPLVQMDLTSSEAVINSETIEMLPVENFDDVVNLQAGVVEGHFRGGRTGEVMYMVDGIPVNDVYSGEAAFQVENSSISELEVISGTFNAEYGQAMSGVVNIVTKDGGADYHGNLSAYFGDYVSTHDDIFWNIDKINPSYNIQGTLHGPLFPRKGDKLTFFASARYFDSEGYRYGKDVFSPSDQSDFSSGPTNTDAWLVSSQGQTYPYSDSLAQALIANADAVPMNPNERLSLQGKLTWKPGNGGKVSYEFFYEDSWHKNYTHEFRLNPYGIYNHNAYGTKHNIAYTHVFSSRTFGSVKLSHFEKKYEQYVNEDPFSDEYVTDQRLQDSGANAFLTGGMQMWHFNRKTRTSLLLLDLTSQIDKYNQVKAGAEYKQHKLWLHEYKVIPELESRISPITTVTNNQYQQEPTEAAAYLQDKIELNFMVMNLGLRFDYFDPGAGVPMDFLNPETSELEDASATYQLSPRMGLAYPITDQGKIHVSYGHFFQTPPLDYLYTNPEFDIYELQSMPSPPPNSQLNIIGNAALKPQKTVSYEIGLQQQIAAELSLDLTVFYKDIRNLVGTEILYTQTGIRYARYINQDYGNVKGVTLSLEKRQSGGVGATLDYTYQIAKGNASDPNTAYLDTQAGKEPSKQMVPLNWDRRHQLNASVSWLPIDALTMSLIGRFGSGFPYTPTYQTSQAQVENSARKPAYLSFDLYADYGFKFGRQDLTLFMRVYNVLDQKNELEVYTDTGRATYSLAQLSTGGLRPQGINTFDEYIARPDYYSAPREVQVGFKWSF